MLSLIDHRAALTHELGLDPADPCDQTMITHPKLAAELGLKGGGEASSTAEERR